MGHRIITRAIPPKKLMIPEKIEFWKYNVSYRHPRFEFYKLACFSHKKSQLSLPGNRQYNKRTKRVNIPRMRSRREKKRKVLEGPIVNVSPIRKRISPSASRAESKKNNTPRNNNATPYNMFKGY